MKKVIHCIIALLIYAIPANAEEPQKGYRGFVDADINIAYYRFDNASNITEWYLGGSTSHGYQFNKNLFVGAGVMIEKSFKYDNWTLPVFLQVRTDQKWGEFTPFGDFRIGYNCCDGGGVYLSPTVGYRFEISKKLNLNVGIGITLRGYSTEHYDVQFYNDPITNEYYYTADYLGTKHHSKAMFSIRVGIDF